MRVWLVAVSAVLVFAACGGRSLPKVPVSSDEAEGVPRAVALENLAAALERAHTLECRAPRAKLNQKTITKWDVGEDTLRIHYVRGKEPIAIDYASVTNVELVKYGRLFIVYLHTLAVSRAEHVRLWYQAEEDAKTAVELLEALRKK
ncbi:MAG: hypothetical protein ACYTAF_15210 [Planctomycetota bacterium]|jgi:hypothetical protein